MTSALPIAPGRILVGEPVGHATKDFSERYASISTELLSLLDTTQPGPRPSDRDLAWLHLEVFSVLRTKDKLKYLAGTESGMGVWVNDIVPEMAARRLREL